MRRKLILVAALNWGLGHATRCIPVIKELEIRGFTPVIASDGDALLLLRKEFPHLEACELPPYNISYSQKGYFLRWKLLWQTPSILLNIQREKKATKQIVEKMGIDGIISDNRFGVRYPMIPNVYITHQLQVLSGNTSSLSTYIHKKYIDNYDECWVPDAPGKINLSGAMGHPKHVGSRLKYIGAISRFKKGILPIKYDYLVLLSGPEPQRSILEKILLDAFEGTAKKVAFVRGVVTEKIIKTRNHNVEIFNYSYGPALEKLLNSSEIVIARSGYTTLLDLAKLEKKAFFIPTPGQCEQKYLAGRLEKLGIAPYCLQKDFSVKLLENAEKYPGFRGLGFSIDFDRLFALFKGE